MTTTSDLALLALDPATGRRRLGTFGEIVLGGGALHDLQLAGRLEVIGTGKRARVAVVDTTPVGTAYLDAGLARLATRRRPATARDAVRLLGKRLPRTVYEALADDGLVEARPRKVLGVFPTTRYLALAQAGRDELAAGVRAVLLGEREADARTGTLGALLGAGRLVTVVVPGRRRREAEKRARVLTDGVWASEAVRAAVKAAQDAMTVAVIAATTTAAAGASS